MVKKLSGLIIVVIFLSCATTAHAVSNDLVNGMITKLWRGVVDTFTGWVEFPAQIIKGYNEGFMDNEDQRLLGAVVGIFDGLGHSAGRIFSGVTEIFTFWAANPLDNEGVGLPLDADYAWEEGEPYDIFDPTFTDAAIKPVGEKILRGLANGLLGFAEVPGQIIKGTSEGAMDLGIVKGLWYWFSRGANGMTDIMTAILPNHIDQKGLPFDEDWPWDALIENMQ